MVLGAILERFRTTLDKIDGRPATASTGSFGYDAGVRLAASAELKIERDFQQSLMNGEVLMNYQPMVRLATGRLAGFEALARWLHPERGMVAPSVFIPIAEAGGLSATLASVCMAQVAQDLPKMMRMALANPTNVEPLRVSVNVCGHDLADPDFVPRLSQIAAGASVGEGTITLELTETALVQSLDAAAASLQTARDCGFNVAVDDFGTGYSSLGYLRTMPVDTLKIDRSFIQGMHDTSTSRPLVASMLHMGETLGLSVVAEGIEAKEDARVLREMGCALGQGYFFGRPRSLAETLYLIRDWSARDSLVQVHPAALVDRTVA
jgi:EAL domain-containing protein (putative c-di-GMP-specific phosphodiesterase class I)